MEYGCIGEKLGHSFSKEIHARLADYSYELCELNPDEVGELLTKREFKAINVTIPYKQTVIPFLDEIDAAAAEIGAVNTIVNRNGRLYGYNTDFAGMRALLKRAAVSVKGKKVLVLGSGGTSKTAVAVAKAEGAAEVFRVSRSGRDGCITYQAAKTQHNDAEVIINTTPVGMFPNINGSAVDLNDFPQVSGVIDAVYNPLNSMLVIQAREKGIFAMGGLYMLVVQAAVAVQHFTGCQVEQSAIDRCFEEIYSSKQNIVLTGMPGCGKSTLGKLIAQRLGMDFCDSDTEIVETEGKAIPEIFEQMGEKGFRDIETKAIERLSARQHTVIATGGGAILRDENIRLLKSNGIICFLDRPLEQLVTTNDRPLSSDREKLKKRYEERYDRYCSTSDLKIDCVDNIEQNLLAMEREFRNEDFGNKRS